MSSIFKGMSFENMARQSGRLYEDLISAYAEIRLAGKYTQDEIHRVEIPQIIKRHTGMTVDLQIDTKYYLAAMIALPQVDRNHPFMSWINGRESFMGSEIGELITNLRTNPAGSVDTKSSRVSGIFSEIPLKIRIGYNLIAKHELSTDELAAITLHELGHGFTYFLHLGTTTSSALMAGSVAKSIMGAETYGERLKVLQRVEDTMKAPIPYKTQIAEQSPEKAAQAAQIVVLKNDVQYNQSQIGMNYYDARACEQLADEFAVKHGAGAALASALNKLGKRFSIRGYLSTSAYIMIEAIKIALFYFLYVIAGFYAPSIRVIFWQAWLTALFSSPAVDIYDSPKDRNKYILQRLIETLKEESLSEVELRQVKEDIEIVKMCMDETHDQRTLLTRFWDVVTTNGRSRKAEELFNKELESLLFNELYDQSANFRLKGISK